MQKKHLKPHGITIVLRGGQRWHAVSVVVKGPCCDAARGLRNARFLSAEAPRLPLPQCTAPHSCSCAYKHHADRRGQPRRKDEATGLRRAFGGEDRRVDPDRRETDN